MRFDPKSLVAKLCLIALPLATLAQPAVAQSSQVFTGKISSIFVSSGYNEAFRVKLTQNGTDVLAHCPYSFAYVNIDTSNYDTYVAELTTFYVRGTTVNVTVKTDSNGFCQMTEFGSA